MGFALRFFTALLFISPPFLPHCFLVPPFRSPFFSFRILVAQKPSTCGHPYAVGFFRTPRVCVGMAGSFSRNVTPPPHIPPFLFVEASGRTFCRYFAYVWLKLRSAFLVFLLPPLVYYARERKNARSHSLMRRIYTQMRLNRYRASILTLQRFTLPRPNRKRGTCASFCLHSVDRVCVCVFFFSSLFGALIFFIHPPPPPPPPAPLARRMRDGREEEKETAGGGWVGGGLGWSFWGRGITVRFFGDITPGCAFLPFGYWGILVNIKPCIHMGPYGPNRIQIQRSIFLKPTPGKLYEKQTNKYIITRQKEKIKT